MPKNYIREFTGGISNKIDPQNLSGSQSVTSVDVDTQGFTLEPGETFNSNDVPGGHFYHRGEWITDKTVLSFEEHGSNVIKTYGDKRPEIEDIVPDSKNTIRDLGVPRPPMAIAEGSIVSEGSISERDASGAHIITMDRFPNSYKWGARQATVDTSAKTIKWLNRNPKTESDFQVGDFVRFESSDNAPNIDRLEVFKITNIDDSYITFSSTPPDIGVSGYNSVYLVMNEQVDSALDTLTTWEDVTPANPFSGKDVIEVYRYGGDTYWAVQETGNLKVSVLNSSNIVFSSADLTHYTGGHFFKDEFFVCWNDDNIQIVTLDKTDLAVETVDIDEDKEFLNDNNFTSTVKSVAMTNGKVNFTQKLTGNVDHPSTYSGDENDIWVWNYETRKQVCFILSDVHTTGNDWTIYYSKDGKETPITSKAVIGGYSASGAFKADAGDGKGPIGGLKYNHITLSPGTGIRIVASGANKPDIYLVDSPEFEGAFLRGDWTRTQDEKEYCHGLLVWKVHRVLHWTIRLQFKGNKIEWRFAEKSAKSGWTWNGKKVFQCAQHDATDYYKHTNFAGIYKRAGGHDDQWKNANNGVRGQNIYYTRWGDKSKRKEISWDKATEGTSSHIGKDKIARETEYASSCYRGYSYSSSTLTKIPEFGRFHIEMTKATFSESAKTITIDQTIEHLIQPDGRTHITIWGQRWNDKNYKVKSVSGSVITVEDDLTNETAYVGIKTYNDYDQYIINTQLSNYFMVRHHIDTNFGVKKYRYQLYSNSDFTRSKDWGSIEHAGTVNAVDYTTPRLIYAEEKAVNWRVTYRLYSVNGIASTEDKKILTFSSYPNFRLDADALVVNAGNGLAVYTPTLSPMYTKEGDGPTGLGLNKGDIVNDAWHIKYSSQHYYVSKTSDDSLLLIKVGDKPEHALLKAPFDEPLYVDADYFYGVKKSGDNFTSIKSIFPFYISALDVGKFVKTVNGSDKIWGIIEDKFIDKLNPMKFYFQVFWMNKVSVMGLSNASSPLGVDTELEFTMSLNSEPNASLTDWADSKGEISFSSLVEREIVIFSSEETNIPPANVRDINTRMSFRSHPRTNTEYFYVFEKNALSLNDDHKVKAHRMIRGLESFDKFDASEIGGASLGGITSFSVGAAQMYDGNGPNIAFYYRASFVDENGLESAPSLLSEKIEGMDSIDDCVRVTFPRKFFDTVKADRVEKLRIYRFGGNFAEFQHLLDVDITDMVQNIVKNKKVFRTLTLNTDVANDLNNASGGSIYPVLTVVGTADPETDIGLNLKSYVNSTIKLSKSNNTSGYDGDWRVIEVRTIDNTYSTSSSGYLINNASNVAQDSMKAAVDTGSAEIKKGSKFKVAGDTNIYEITKDAAEDATEIEFKPGVVPANWADESAITWQLPHYNILLETKENHYTVDGTTLTWTANSSAAPSSADYASAKIEVTDWSIRDKKRVPPPSLYTPNDDLWPPLDYDKNSADEKFLQVREKKQKFYRYVRNINGMFFGALGNEIHYSLFGDPDAWPIDAYQEIDNDITGILEHAGEGLVFTTTSVYRVRGSDPKMMVAFRIPDGKGLASGMENTLVEYMDRVFWLHTDGICMYSNNVIQVITKNRMMFDSLDNPSGTIADGKYWIIQRKKTGATRLGYVVNLDTEDLRITETTVEGDDTHTGRFAFYSKEQGAAYVITGIDNSNTITGGSLDGTKASTLEWKSKEIDGGEPNISKTLINLEFVYDCLSYDTDKTDVNGVKGYGELTKLLTKTDLGKLTDESISNVSLLSIQNKYDLPDTQISLEVGDTDVTTLTEEERKTISVTGISDRFTVGDYVWGELLDDASKVESIPDANNIILDKEPLKSGDCRIWWGSLPLVSVYLDDSSSPAKQFILPPLTEDAAPSTVATSDTQTVDLYLDDLQSFRTISIQVEGAVKVKSIGYRMEPMQLFQSNTLYHSADVFYRGKVDLRFILDGDTVYRKILDSDNFAEKRVYLPSSSFGQKMHFRNESRTGMVNDVTFQRLDLNRNQEVYA